MAYSDDISSAPDITSGGGDWDNLTATDNAGEPLNVASSSNNVWQKVHLVTAGAYIFSHDTAGDAGDTVMTIYQGPAGAAYADLVFAGSGDDEAGSSKPKITYGSPGSEWIYIESTGYAGALVSGQTTLVLFAPDWVTSQVTFTAFNADPLPTDLSHVSGLIGVTSLAYGAVVGSSPLDTADTGTSYVAVERPATGSTATAVTMRPVITPPVPFASADLDGVTYDSADFAASAVQMAFQFAPPVLPFSGTPNTPPDWFLTDAAVTTAAAEGFGEPRGASDPPWSNSWWDETTCGVHGGAPLFSSAHGLTDVGTVIDAAHTSGYLVMFGKTTSYPGYDAIVVVSHLTFQFKWKAPPGPITTLAWRPFAAGAFETGSGDPLYINTPGLGLVPVLDGPG